MPAPSVALENVRAELQAGVDPAKDLRRSEALRAAQHEAGRARAHASTNARSIATPAEKKSVRCSEAHPRLHPKSHGSLWWRIGYACGLRSPNCRQASTPMTDLPRFRTDIDGPSPQLPRRFAPSPSAGARGRTCRPPGCRRSWPRHEWQSPQHSAASQNRDHSRPGSPEVRTIRARARQCACGSSPKSAAR